MLERQMSRNIKKVSCHDDVRVVNIISVQRKLKAKIHSCTTTIKCLTLSLMTTTTNMATELTRALSKRT